MSEPVLKQVFQFGRHLVSGRQVFLQTPLCYAFTNRKPVLPGHVLVSTQRVVRRFAELTQEEVTDLFLTAHRIAPVLQREFDSSSLTLAIQDGIDAGQTVEHVHVHLIPRRPGDFQRNDDIYEELEGHDKGDGSRFRSEAEMEMEARHLAQFFQDT